MLLGSLLSSGGSARQQLRRLLSDGNTVAQYRADVGVTGSLAVSSWANQLGSAPALAQGTGGNQPIYLPFSGSKYLWTSGVSGNSATTPSAAANQITGDIALVFVGAMDAWGSASRQDMVGKWEAANAYLFGIPNGVSTPDISWVTSGGLSKQVICSANNGFSAGASGGLAVTLEVATGTVKFWKTTSTGEPSALTWAQLGNTDSSVGATSIKSTAAVVRVNGRDASNGQWAGKTYRAQIYNGIPAFLGGAASNTPVVDFNPESSAETTTNGATWTSATGEVWTLNATGSKPAQVVGSAQLLLDGSASCMSTSAFSLAQPYSIYLVTKPITWTNTDYILEGNGTNSPIIRQSGVTPQIDIYAGSGAATNAALTLNAYGVIQAVFNGASSSLAVNATNATGNPGAGGFTTGMTLGAFGSGPSFANIQVKELILRSAADSAATRALIYQYLRAIHGTP